MTDHPCIYVVCEIIPVGDFATEGNAHIPVAAYTSDSLAKEHAAILDVGRPHEVIAMTILDAVPPIVTVYAFSCMGKEGTPHETITVYEEPYVEVRPWLVEDQETVEKIGSKTHYFTSGMYREEALARLAQLVGRKDILDDADEDEDDND